MNFGIHSKFTSRSS